MRDCPSHCDYADPKSFLWINPISEKNQLADAEFVEAAYGIGRGFFSYRGRELNDQGRMIELVELAVHLASRARKPHPVVKPQAYLFRVFANLVDAEIARYRRAVPLTDEMLRKKAGRLATDMEMEIDRKTNWKRILETFNPVVRIVYEKLMQGRTIHEIAIEMGVKPNTLAQRIHRARRQLKNSLERKRAIHSSSQLQRT